VKRTIISDNKAKSKYLSKDENRTTRKQRRPVRAL